MTKEQPVGNHHCRALQERYSSFQPSQSQIFWCIGFVGPLLSFDSLLQASFPVNSCPEGLLEAENPSKHVGLIRMQVIIPQLDVEQLFQARQSDTILLGMKKRLLPTIHIPRQAQFLCQGIWLALLCTFSFHHRNIQSWTASSENQSYVSCLI